MGVEETTASATYLQCCRGVLAIHVEYGLIQLLLAADLLRFTMLLCIGHELF